jgi:hypothetical protein
MPVIPKLGSYKVGLNLAITPRKLTKIGSVVKECEKNDVELNFWPLLSKSQGYWVNVWNLNVQAKWINYLLNNFPTISSYLLDLEKPMNYRGLKGNIAMSKLKKIIPNSKVKEKLNSIVDNIHDFNKKAVSTSYGGLPLGLQPRPSNADYYSYMVYLSFILRFSDINTREDILFYCANKIRKDHGREKGAIDLGVTYSGVITEGIWSKIIKFLDLNELARQIEICLFARMKRIQIFALDNLTEKIDKVLERLTSLKPRKPPIFFPEKKSGFMLKAYRKVLFPRDRDLSKL